MNTLMQQYLVLRSMLTEKAEDETGAETIEIILGVIGAIALAAAIWAGINAYGQGKIGDLG